jgi:plastocyanin
VTRMRYFMIAVGIALLAIGVSSFATPQSTAASTPCPAAASATPSPGASPTASPSATSEASAKASPAASPTGAACTVEIRDFAFHPAEIEIAAGTTVTWTNNDTVAHTATATDGTFDSGILDPGASFKYTFDKPGTYDFACLIHPKMKGTITVR